MEDVSFPRGFEARGIACGIKKNGQPDLGVLVSDPPARVFGSFTRNAAAAAPVAYCRQLLASGAKISHVLVNSGNANAGTGARGYDDALRTAELVKEKTRAAGEVMVSSTGVIGEYLPMDKLAEGIGRLFSEGGSFDAFVRSIMTTDTFEKKVQRSLNLDGKEIRLGGVAKGAGMIRPDMATMLAYFCTDLELDAGYEPVFQQAVEKSFNSISVDGDMSTNDTALLLANGASGVRYTELSPASKNAFDAALAGAMEDLAKAIVRDGEGATKLITLEVRGAPTVAEAKMVCAAIANSPLVKTAFFGGDANWGRVVAAAGASGVKLDMGKLALDFCGVPVLKGGGALAYSEDDLAARMRAKDVSVKVDLGLGNAAWTYWTCDLSYEYVKINGSYRT